MKNDLQKEFEKSFAANKDEMAAQIKTINEAIKKILYLSEDTGIPFQVPEIGPYIPSSFYDKFMFEPEEYVSEEEFDSDDFEDANEYFESILGIEIPRDEVTGWLNSSSYC